MSHEKDTHVSLSLSSADRPAPASSSTKRFAGHTKLMGRMGGQPGNFLNIKTATCVSGMCWSDVLLFRGKILNSEIITIWKTGWKPTFQHEARHYCWAEPEQARLGCSPLTMTSVRTPSDLSLEERHCSRCRPVIRGENFQPSWLSQSAVRMERGCASF